MDRRLFLQSFGAGVASLSLPAVASQPLSCKIIGIGAAGCNLAVALRANNILDRADAALSYVCIDLGPHALEFVDIANDANPALTPIKTLMLAPLRAGGRVNAARAACLHHRAVLTDMLTGSDMVVLLAGLGGGTGSGVTPIMVRAARDAGALTVAAVVTPFDYEGVRNRRADAAINRLQREADLVMAFSNEEWINRYRDDTPLFDVFDALDRHIADRLSSVISRLNTPKSQFSEPTRSTVNRRCPLGPQAAPS
jgi:cell division protein FtsZ